MATDPTLPDETSAHGAPSGEVLVDARGHRCPVPTLRLRRALEGIPPGTRVRLLADDPLARIDVPHFAAQAGVELLERGEADGTLIFVVAAL
jgi:tRNA 2-thiouridine synthesizing protein A